MRIRIIYLLVLIFSSSTNAASFDCNKAASKIEKMICSDSDLGSLDEELSKAYKLSRSLMQDDQKIILKKEQRTWLKERNKECINIKACESSYSNRISSLLLKVSNGKKLTVSDIPNNFNLRSIRSLYSKKLKYFCESHLEDYFSTIKVNSSNQLTMTNPGLELNISISEKNIITIFEKNHFTKKDSQSTHRIFYDITSKEWRSLEVSINTSDNCINYEYQGFDGSWTSEYIHDQCRFMESKEFLINSEDWSIIPGKYGSSIGSSNALLDKEERVQNGVKYNISYYHCPKNCFKSGASQENKMLGKEHLLSIIDYAPIECRKSLIVPELLEFDFDNDGFMGYAIRYKTAHGGFEGSRGWLYWDISFIKNTSGKLSKLTFDKANLGDDIEDVYYHKLVKNNKELTIQFYTIKISGSYEIVNRDYHFDGVKLIPSN